ncbi:hypothetical protein MRB53_028380 [Persea americana]|uniref:Uncharacterized protein n=1 Tax=Persea americana TaxID=3435 RepID=A0ACC2KFQ5_PERAE|nr:hypothetical protein MRB53_028380 [Persea americana]
MRQEAKRELAETSTAAAEAETSPRPRSPIIESLSSEEEEEEEEMVLKHRLCVPIADFEAQVFGDRAPDALTSAGDAPALALVHASTSPAVIVCGTPSPSAGARQHSAEIPREEG